MELNTSKAVFGNREVPVQTSNAIDETGFSANDRGEMASLVYRIVANLNNTKGLQHSYLPQGNNFKAVISLSFEDVFSDDYSPFSESFSCLPYLSSQDFNELFLDTLDNLKLFPSDWKLEKEESVVQSPSVGTDKHLIQLSYTIPDLSQQHEEPKEEVGKDDEE